MRVGIIQSNYIPWRGYFDFIDDVDLFIFLDDVQYTKRDWRNRNKIKSPSGEFWLTVPVEQKRRSQLIDETTILASVPWKRKHLNAFDLNYSKARYAADAYSLFERGLSLPADTISELNIGLIKLICAYLGIETQFMLSSELETQGCKTEKLIALLEKVGADEYLSGLAAADYLDLELFEKHEIRLEYKQYDYAPYPQLWGEFSGNLSVLDLIANTGRDAIGFLKSNIPNKIVH